MEDRDYLQLCALIALVAIGGILQSRVLKKHSEQLVRHDEEITFLRIVARETEKRLADD